MDSNSLVVQIVGCAAVAAGVSIAQRQLGFRVGWLMMVGGLAVLGLEVAIILLLANTGDHFDGTCMQPAQVCIQE